MQLRFTLKYWRDGGWYAGRLKEVPGVFTQGEQWKLSRRIFATPASLCSRTPILLRSLVP